MTAYSSRDVTGDGDYPAEDARKKGQTGGIVRSELLL